MDGIRAKEEAFKDVIGFITFERDILINLFKEKILETSNKHGNEIVISESEMKDRMRKLSQNSKLNNQNLGNAFAWLESEKVTYEYKWNNFRRELYLTLSW